MQSAPEQKIPSPAVTVFFDSVYAPIATGAWAERCSNKSNAAMLSAQIELPRFCHRKAKKIDLQNCREKLLKKAYHGNNSI